MTRSENMAAIKRRDTSPELLLRRFLWASGIRGYRVDAKLLGHPDLYFPRARLAIFIDGCFWHGCPDHFSAPKSNHAYWGPKIAGNQSRDVSVNQNLKGQGIRVVRFWTHEVEDNLSEVAARIEVLLRGDLSK